MKETANEQFAQLILDALKSGPLTTHELGVIAQKRLPHLCSELSDWKHSLRGSQSSLQHQSQIRRVLHRLYTWELVR